MLRPFILPYAPNCCQEAFYELAHNDDPTRPGSPGQAHTKVKGHKVLGEVRARRSRYSETGAKWTRVARAIEAGGRFPYTS